MESTTHTQTFDSDLQEMVQWCRTLDSREQWPGTTTMGRRENKLSYMISIRIKSGSMADADTEEIVGPVSESGGVVEFTTEQTCIWPEGVNHNSTRYRFTPGAPNTLEFTYSYETPTTKLVKTKNLPAFRGSMAKVVGIYVDKLVTGRPASARSGAASVSG